MNHIQIKLMVGLLAIAGAVGYLFHVGVTSGWVYSMDVDAFIAKTEYHDQRVRLQGIVGWENVEVNRGLLLARFELVHGEARLPVEYRGVVPDMFRAGHEVIVEGRLDEHGVFAANVLMTRCASKYDEESPHAPEAQRELPGRAEGDRFDTHGLEAHVSVESEQ